MGPNMACSKLQVTDTNHTPPVGHHRMPYWGQVLFQLPIYPNNISWFGFMLHMTNLDSLDYNIQYLRSQLLDGCVFADFGVYLSAFHAFGKCLYLLKHIWIEHIVVNSMCLGAYLWVGIVVHTQVNIRLPIFQLLSGNHQRMTAAFTEQFPSEQVEPMI